MAELLPCPFCNSAGEIYKGRSYAPNCKTFATEAEAEDWITEMRQKYIIKAEAITERHFKRGIKFTARVEKQAFIPRCTKPGCLGRNVILFSTQEAAEAAWNRRAESEKQLVDSVGESICAGLTAEPRPEIYKAAKEIATAALREQQNRWIPVAERLPTAEEYRTMHPQPKVDLQRWSEPKYLCPKCGGGMCKDQMFVLTSYPEKYTYECNQCGYTETQYR